MYTLYRCISRHAYTTVILSDSLLSSSSKVVLNSPQDDDRIMVDKPVSFSEMLVVKIKELLEGNKNLRVTNFV